MCYGGNAERQLIISMHKVYFWLSRSKRVLHRLSPRDETVLRGIRFGSLQSLGIGYWFWWLKADPGGRTTVEGACERGNLL